MIDGLLRPVKAGRRRRRAMREELLAHLRQAYEEELAQGQDESAAFDAVVRRFGRPDELQRLIQASVPPLERWLAQMFDPMEDAMSIGPRFAGWVLCLVGAAFAFGLAVVMPATAKLAGLISASSRAGEALDAERVLKASLISLVAFAFFVTLAGLSILAYAFITRKRAAQ
ncbi:MAG TPA: permease prefix domain 1-containing protein [Tepidisphaeraceae bacterium]